MKTRTEFLRELEDIFGSRLLVEDIPKSYWSDETKIEAPPSAVVRPKDASEVEELVKLAVEFQVPVVARGSGTGLSGGAVPVPGCVVVDFTAMNRVLEVRPEDHQVLVEPGVIYDELNAQLAEHGLFLPPNPASGDQCTIGGMVAENASGPRSYKYGPTRDWVIGLEVITPALGRIWVGSRTRKHVSTYGLTSLFVGSEGTLGLFTKVLFKLAPAPPARLGVILPFSDIRDAGRAVYALFKAGLDISALELVDRLTMEAVNKFYKVGFPEEDAVVMLEVECWSKDEDRRFSEMELKLAELEATISALGISCGEPSVFFNADEMWSKRALAAEALEKVHGCMLMGDVIVPPSRLPELVERIRDLAERYGLPIAIFGHAGDGHLHPTILVAKEDLFRPDVREAEREIVKLAVQLGGALSGEHGIGMTRIGLLELEVSQQVVRLCQELKAVLDPYGIMNPGKKVPIKGARPTP